MKHVLKPMVAFALAACLAVVLGGCAQLGLGMQPGKPQLGNAMVTSPALGQDGVLRVGIDSANAPFATQVDDGRLVGIDADVAAALATQMGLKLELVDVGQNGEAALEDGTVDIVMGRDKSDTASSCWMSDPYLESAVALWAASTGTVMPTTASKPKIEAQEASMSAWEVTNQFGEDALVAVPDLKTAFEDLANGTTELVAADIIIGSYVNHTTSGSNAQVLGLMQTPGGYCVGVASANNDLKAAVASALRSIDDGGVVDVVLEKWLGTTFDLDAMQMTEQAAKASGRPSGSELSGVGSNAADIDAGASSADPAIVDGTATAGSNYVEYTPAYTDEDTGYTGGYTDYSAADTGAETAAATNVEADTGGYEETPTYVEETPTYTEDAGGYVEDAGGYDGGDTGEAEAEEG